MVEALDPPRVVPTSMSNICKVFDKLHMLSKGLWRSISTTLQLHLLVKIWEINCNSGSHLLGYYCHHFVMVEALDPPRVVPTSMSNICKVFDKLHMLWMG
jgi:hypothetical protein